MYAETDKLQTNFKGISACLLTSFDGTRKYLFDHNGVPVSTFEADQRSRGHRQRASGAKITVVMMSSKQRRLINAGVGCRRR